MEPQPQHSPAQDATRGRPRERLPLAYHVATGVLMPSIVPASVLVPREWYVLAQAVWLVALLGLFWLGARRVGLALSIRNWAAGGFVAQVVVLAATLGGLIMLGRYDERWALGPLVVAAMIVTGLISWRHDLGAAAR